MQRLYNQPYKSRSSRFRPQPILNEFGSVVTQAIRSARLAIDMQETVRQQLEVVEFSIDRIFDEIADVMTLTPEMATIRKRPTPGAAPYLRIAA